MSSFSVKFSFVPVIRRSASPVPCGPRTCGPSDARGRHHSLDGSAVFLTYHICIWSCFSSLVPFGWSVFPFLCQFRADFIPLALQQVLSISRVWSLSNHLTTIICLFFQVNFKTNLSIPRLPRSPCVGADQGHGELFCEFGWLQSLRLLGSLLAFPPVRASLCLWISACSSL